MIGCIISFGTSHQQHVKIQSLNSENIRNSLGQELNLNEDIHIV